jgi:hypothetical protein
MKQYELRRARLPSLDIEAANMVLSARTETTRGGWAFVDGAPICSRRRAAADG